MALSQPWSAEPTRVVGEIQFGGCRMVAVPRFACLFGNGASTIYSDELTIASLTKAIVKRFAALADRDTALEDLAALAKAFHGESRHDFESLLGPLDTMAEALPYLSSLAKAFGGGDEFEDAAAPLLNRVKMLHRVGLATTLDLIADRTHQARSGQFNHSVGRVAKAIRDLRGHTTVGTLNYDGLLHGGLLGHRQVADLARGYDEQAIAVVHDGPKRTGYPMRTGPDFPNDANVVILQLHGSLGWLRLDDGEVRCFSIDHLRQDHYWKRLAEGASDWSPVVVLTDRKGRAVSADPFALAYQLLTDAFIEADRWLVAGYSFQDTPVNKMLSSAFARRVALGQTAPRILILDIGDEAVVRDNVTPLLPNGADVQIDLTGLPDSVEGERWLAWSAP